MKTWFTSLNGAITLSALALLSFIGYAFMEARYFLEKWIPGMARRWWRQSFCLWIPDSVVPSALYSCALVS